MLEKRFELYCPSIHPFLSEISVDNGMTYREGRLTLQAGSVSISWLYL